MGGLDKPLGKAIICEAGVVNQSSSGMDQQRQRLTPQLGARCHPHLLPAITRRVADLGGIHCLALPPRRQAIPAAAPLIG